MICQCCAHILFLFAQSVNYMTNDIPYYLFSQDSLWYRRLDGVCSYLREEERQ